MSFSSSVKNELSRLDISNKCCNIAEINAIMILSSIIKFDDNLNTIKINSENASVVRRIFNLFKELYGISVKIVIKRNKSSKHMHFYHVTIDNRKEVIRILKDIGVSSKTDIKKLANDDKLFQYSKNCCKKAFIRGAFLSAGSISDPEKTYHLEFVARTRDIAKKLLQILSDFNINPRIAQRKNNFIVYFKGSEDIVDLLNIIGAHKSLLELENIRVMKELRNNVNRVVNCETANLGKTVNAAVRQINSIKYIQNTIGLNKLPNNLQEVARLRLKYQEASLKELGEMLTPKVGKSGINHRLRKIIKIADEIKNNN